MEDAEKIAFSDLYWFSHATADRVRVGGSGRAAFEHEEKDATVNAEGPGGTGFGATVNLKGLGPTGLEPRDGAENARDGKLNLNESVKETVNGELCAHLFGNSSRVLAIIRFKEPGGSYLIVRAGNLLRPAHFHTRDTEHYEDLLRLVPSYKQIIKMVAKSAAAMNQFRILHAGVNSSNMGVFGTQLDLGTMTTQPWTDPITNIYYMGEPETTRDMHPRRRNRHVFGAEHKAFLKYLKEILPPWHTWSWTSIYRHAKNVETLRGCGLKEEVAEELLRKEPRDAHKLAKHIRRLGRWHHGNEGNTKPAQGDEWTERAVLADNHKMMRELPAVFFDHDTGNCTEGVTEDAVRETLDLNLERKNRTLEENQQWREDIPLNKKYGISSPEEGDKQIRKSVAVIRSLYPKLMNKAAAIGIKVGAYESRQDFAASLQGRAAFENEPIKSTYSPDVTDRVVRLVEQCDEEKVDYEDFYKKLSTRVPELIEDIVSNSKRRVDDLLFNTQARRGTEPDTWRLQMQNIGGVLHYIEAEDDEGNPRSLCLEIPVESLTGDQRAALPDGDGPVNGCEWAGTAPETSGASGATFMLKDAGSDKPFLKVRIPARPYQYGRFEGTLTIGGEEIAFPQGTRKYTYAVPDKQELRAIVENAKIAEPEVEPEVEPKEESEPSAFGPKPPATEGDVPRRRRSTAEELRLRQLEIGVSSNIWADDIREDIEQQLGGSEYIYATAFGSGADPFNLQRFMRAHAGKVGGYPGYETALAELQDGTKISHWIWYVFPMALGVATSKDSMRYGISSLDEAQAYLGHSELGARLRQCANLVLGELDKGRTLDQILGPDAWKFKASMTLFAEATKGNPTGPDKVFHDCVAKHGRDTSTDRHLQAYGN